MSEKKLSKGEKKVIALFDGIPKTTAKKCKLSPCYVRQILMKPYIKKIINEREAAELKEELTPLIADRKERQAFWSSVMRGIPQVVKLVEKKDDDGEVVLDDKGDPVMIEIREVTDMKNRLKSAELLGRSNADFIDKIHVIDDTGVPQKITDDMEPKQATNIYLDMVKGRPAGNA